MRIEPEPIDRLLLPFQRFFKLEAAGGIVLLLATVVALIWANSPWADSYFSIWETKLTAGFGDFEISKALMLWINDGLMAIFFLLVGLEIKRELLVGELSSPKRALLPAAAALGGMVGPALIFLMFNAGTDSADAWGAPMATDIAFAVGVLALLGHRIPVGLRVFLVALAIVDDLGAIAIVALVYTDEIASGMLLAAAAPLCLLIIFNLLGVRRILPYLVLGVVLWVLILKSGVHATVAGVLLAATIPSRILLTGGAFRKHIDATVGHLNDDDQSASIYASQPRQAAIHHLEEACQHAQAPLLRIEHALLPWVSFFIMPLFALANAGVDLGSGLSQAATSRISLGIVVGLIVGNQIGITGMTWLVVKLGLCSLPTGVRMIHVYGASCLAGIGFTMALFIAGLAFDDAARLDLAKVGILAGSLISGILGVIVLSRIKSPQSSIQK